MDRERERERSWGRSSPLDQIVPVFASGGNGSHHQIMIKWQHIGSDGLRGQKNSTFVFSV